MKKSISAEQSTGECGQSPVLRGIVEKVVSGLQRQHADSGVPLPHVSVDVPDAHRFEGNVVAQDRQRCRFVQVFGRKYGRVLRTGRRRNYVTSKAGGR